MISKGKLDLIPDLRTSVKRANHYTLPPAVALATYFLVKGIGPNLGLVFLFDSLFPAAVVRLFQPNETEDFNEIQTRIVGVEGK